MKNKLFIIPSLLVATLGVGFSIGYAADAVAPVSESSEDLKMQLAISGTNRIEIGGQTLLRLSIENGSGGFSWESSDMDVATVDGGLVTGLSAGTVTITARSMEDISVTTTYEVTVVKDLDGKYSVTFLDYDGSLLYKTYVEEGEAASYQGPTPTRMNTYDKMYEFLRWDTDLTSISENTVVRAVYAESDFGDYLFEDLGTSYKLVGYVGSDTVMTTPTSFNLKPVTAIGSRIIENNATLEELIVSEGIETIDEYAFANTTALKKVTFPSSVYSYGSNVCYRCYALEEVVFAEGAARTGQYMFNQCAALVDVTLPSTLTTLADYTFFMCDGLTEFTVPASVTTIGNGCFTTCRALETVTIEGDIESFGTAVFSTCSALKVLNYDGGFGTVFPANTFSGCTALESFVIPDEVEEIGMQAFRNTSGLTSLTLPTNLKSIGSNSFTGSSILNFDEATQTYPSLVIKEGDTNLSIKDGLLVGSGGKRAIMALGGFSIEDFDCPTLGITELGAYALYQNKTVKTINLTGVTYFGTYSLYQVHGSIGTLQLDENVTEVGEYAFGCNASNNMGITTLVIDTTFGDTNTIPYRAFRNITTLQTLAVRSDITAVDDAAFGWCATNFRNAYLPKTLKSIGAQSFYSNTNLTVSFEGTAEEWANVSKESNSFSSATVLNRTKFEVALPTDADLGLGA